VLEGGEQATRNTLVLDVEVEFAPLRAGHSVYCNAPLLEAGLSETASLKLVLILAAYRQLDLALELVRAPGSALAGISPPVRSRLEQLLLNRPNALIRLARRVFRGLDSQRRRAVVDA
jgi:hypothetical protein